ncbi:methionine ABC transporter ATP-binding protein [Sediminivirga luteola]|uniref:Methionine import ATP-binding protein MetN n=1 Tax=Sediminivirga luteola TaxID=1774748 RepID=A0A8J2U0S4_9MICO|nr:methionine ABC transporter ATP-binding protein [Sediminivirga luteola]MCI2265032.1 methionine ABC transporter ATP-binding protein [Sediminivirga luteola]GGA25318.1 methionine import ATP-binding protein MetN [Sediminivirga luteola]
MTAGTASTGRADDAGAAGEPLIEFDRVTKSFGTGPEQVTALNGVSLTVGRGDIHAVIGRSGAGKSTLIRTINGLTGISGGRLVVDGEDIAAIGPGALRRKRRDIGMIFQHFNLYERRTVAQNVAFPLEIHRLPQARIRERVARVIDLVGLSDRAGHYPAQLSGGQKQRVGIARALVTEPRILLSDEATSALDSETTLQILHLLQDIRDRLGVTIVLITHELDVVKHAATHATLLEHGTVADSGRVRDLVLDRSSTLGAALFPHRLDQHGRHEHAGELLMVTFEGNLAAAPYWSQIARVFGVDVTIVSVSSDRIAGTWFSRFHLRITPAPGGHDEDAPVPLTPIAAWLRERGADAVPV